MKINREWSTDDDPKQGSGMEDDLQFEPCMNPSHDPPNMLYVPPGKRYRHVCPGCGKVSYIRGSNIRLQVSP